MVKGFNFLQSPREVNKALSKVSLTYLLSLKNLEKLCIAKTEIPRFPDSKCLAITRVDKTVKMPCLIKKTTKK